MIGRFILCGVLWLTACTGAPKQSWQDYLTMYHVPPSSPGALYHCHGYGCRLITPVTLTPKEWGRIEALFKPRPKNAAQERQKIAHAIGMLEQIIGAKDGTAADVMGTFRHWGNDQLDCVDESTNTTTYLSMLQSRKLLRFHTLESPSVRLPIIHAGRWPHQSATIRETKTGMEYVVDSWFQDNGKDADIVDLATWRKGWRPPSIGDANL